MANKNRGSSFKEYLLESLKGDDQAVFLHIKEALENPDIKANDDYLYLLKAINDVATARGKGDLAENSGLSRQGLHKILNGESIPNIQNIMAILNAIGLRFSVEQIREVVSEDKPASVLDIAEYASTIIARNSTYMKLQKIVYYAQVESLVHYAKPLFSEKILAWRGGPVVRELFEKHQGYKVLNNINLGSAANLSMEQRACVNWAVEKYGNLDGDTLSHLTHLELPWNNARKGLPPDAPSDAEITLQSMMDYYSNLPKYRELEEQDEAVD
jgi:probable addiction module antidote protein